MFWDDEKDSEDAQKLKNLLFIKMWATNKDRDDIMPFFAVVGVIAIIILVVAALV